MRHFNAIKCVLEVPQTLNSLFVGGVVVTQAQKEGSAQRARARATASFPVSAARVLAVSGCYLCSRSFSYFTRFLLFFLKDPLAASRRGMEGRLSRRRGAHIHSGARNVQAVMQKTVLGETEVSLSPAV